MAGSVGRTAPPRGEADGGVVSGKRFDGFDLVPVITFTAVLAAVLWLAATSVTGPTDHSFWQYDLSQTELKTDGALRFRQLTGAHSTYGFQHPGPWYFYWMAPFYALFDHRIGGLQVGTAMFHLTALGSMLVILRRYVGGFVTVAASLTVAVWVHRYGVEYFFAVWNPMVTSTLTIAFIAIPPALAVTTRGHRWLLAAAVGSGSMLVQAHVGAAGIVLSGLVLTGIWAWSALRRSASRFRAVSPTLAIAALLWTPVLVDQMAGSRNVTTLVEYFVTGPMSADSPVTQGGREPGLASRSLSKVAAGTTLRLDDLGSSAGIHSVGDDGEDTGWKDTALLVGLGAANIAAVAIGRRRSQFVWAAGITTLTMLYTSLVSLLLIKGRRADLYQLHFVTGIGYWLWTVPLIWVAVSVRSRPLGQRATASPRAPRLAASMCTAVSLLVLFHATPRTISNWYARTRLTPAVLLLQQHPEVEAVNVEIRSRLLWNLMGTTAIDLTRAGVEVWGTKEYQRLFPSDRVPEQARYPTLLLLVEPDQPDDADAIRLGPWSMGSNPEGIGVYLLPAGG